MGTYKLRVISIASKSSTSGFTWEAFPGPSTADADIVAALFDQSATNYVLLDGAIPGAVDGQIRCNAKFYLDGDSSPTEINSLPAGFIITSAAVASHIERLGGSPPPPTSAFLQFDLSRESTAFTNTANPASYAYPSSLPSAFALYAAGFGIRTTGTFPGPFFRIDYLEITGNYSLAGVNYTLETPTDPVGPGDQITVTSVEPSAMNMDNITQVDVQFLDASGNVVTVNVPPTSWITVTQYLFVFELPSFGVHEPQVINILFTGDGTQFSGSITLGRLITIFFINAPGIYRLVTNKTNDTLYDVENGGTIDVKIPNPFIDTGFLP